MNVENILRVADAIEQHSIPDLGFNMELYGKSAAIQHEDRSGHAYGTTACIAGWTAVVGGFRKAGQLSDREGEEIKEFSESYFGINEGDGDELFAPSINRDDVTPAQAVRTLRHLAATGEVNWNPPETEA